MNILMVTPYPDLYQTAQEVISSLRDDVILIEGDLDAGLKKAKEVIRKNNIEIIISRGGTASLLRNSLNITVLEIRVTGYDLLRAVYPCLNSCSKIAVVGYENIISGAKSIREILKTDLGIFTLKDDIRAEKTIDSAIEWGAEIIIGDVISTEIAGKKGVKTELIRSGKEAIEDSLREAFQLKQEMIIKTTNIKRLNSMVEHSENGIIYIDSEGKIIQVNTAALECLQKTRGQLLNTQAESSCLPELFKKHICSDSFGNEKSGIIKIGLKTLFIDVAHIIVNEKKEGCIVFIHDSGRIQYLEALIRKELSSKGLKAGYTFDKMNYRDPKNYEMINKAKQFSLTDSTILLYGETGTGKELFAQSIHNNSRRKDGPFVAINCAALPDSLLESELFGYAEGAFTGALKGGKKGLFELAHMGTFFLDEISEMNLALQSRLLRVLQEKEIMVLGDNKVVHVDVRIIAASNRNLYQETAAGRFRSDLYYRIKVLDIEILPLRERTLDIIPMFTAFVEHFSIIYSYEPPGFDSSLVDNLLAYSWPGNIRELRNFAEKFTILSSIYDSTTEISRELFKDSHQQEIRDNPSIPAAKSLKEMEQAFILSVLEQTNFNISKAAQILGIERVTLRRKIRDKLPASPLSAVNEENPI